MLRRLCTFSFLVLFAACRTHDAALTDAQLAAQQDSLFRRDAHSLKNWGHDPERK